MNHAKPPSHRALPPLNTRPAQSTARKEWKESLRGALQHDEHLRTIRAQLSADEQAVFDRGVARMRQGPGGLARIAKLSVDDVIAELRFEIRSSPLIPSPDDPPWLPSPKDPP